MSKTPFLQKLICAALLAILCSCEVEPFTVERTTVAGNHTKVLSGGMSLLVNADYDERVMTVDPSGTMRIVHKVFKKDQTALPRNAANQAAISAGAPVLNNLVKGVVP